MRANYVEYADNYAADIVAWVRRQLGAGKHAVHVNKKTLMSIDISSNCPLMKGGTPCAYCYRYMPEAHAELLAKDAGMTVEAYKKLKGGNPTKAPKSYDFAPYKDEILQMDPDLIKFMNDKMGGLRVNSFGDYEAWQKPILDKIMADAQKRGLKLKIITKQPEMIAVYGGRPGVSFNVSTDFAPEFAHLITNDSRLRALLSKKSSRKIISSAMDPDEVVKLKKKDPSIKSRYVAIGGRQEAIAAVADPRFDVVTLYHGMTGEEFLTRVWKHQRPEFMHQTTTKTASGVEKTNPPTLGERNTRALARAFKVENAKKFRGSVTQEELDQVLGKGKMTVEAFNRKALDKLCCQTGNCSTCPALCGLKAGTVAVLVGMMLNGTKGIALNEMADYLQSIGEGAAAKEMRSIQPDAIQ